MTDTQIENTAIEQLQEAVAEQKQEIATQDIPSSVQAEVVVPTTVADVDPVPVTNDYLQPPAEVAKVIRNPLEEPVTHAAPVPTPPPQKGW